MDDRTELTEAEYDFICDESWKGGAKAWRAAIDTVLAARVSALSRDLAAQNTRIEEYAAQIDRMNATIALLTLHNAFEGAAQITSAALSVSDPGQDKENNR